MKARGFNPKSHTAPSTTKDKASLISKVDALLADQSLTWAYAGGVNHTLQRSNFMAKCGS